MKPDPFQRLQKPSRNAALFSVFHSPLCIDVLLKRSNCVIRKSRNTVSVIMVIMYIFWSFWRLELNYLSAKRHTVVLWVYLVYTNENTWGRQNSRNTPVNCPKGEHYILRKGEFYCRLKKTEFILTECTSLIWNMSLGEWVMNVRLHSMLWCRIGCI